MHDHQPIKDATVWARAERHDSSAYTRLLDEHQIAEAGASAESLLSRNIPVVREDT